MLTSKQISAKLGWLKAADPVPPVPPTPPVDPNAATMPGGGAGTTEEDPTAVQPMPALSPDQQMLRVQDALLQGIGEDEDEDEDEEGLKSLPDYGGEFRPDQKPPLSAPANNSDPNAVFRGLKPGEKTPQSGYSKTKAQNTKFNDATNDTAEISPTAVEREMVARNLEEPTKPVKPPKKYEHVESAKP